MFLNKYMYKEIFFMPRASVVAWICVSSVFDLIGADHSLDPCRLACHLEHAVDICKLVESDNESCKNMYWTANNKTSLFVDIVRNDDDLLVHVSELITLLRADKGGCEQMCKSHEQCIHIGSNCKPNDTCMNLFWNKGQPVESELTTCYESPGAGCEDVVPVLCGSFMKSGPTGVPGKYASHSSSGDQSDPSDELKKAVDPQQSQVAPKSSVKTPLTLLAIYAILITLSM